MMNRWIGHSLHSRNSEIYRIFKKTFATQIEAIQKLSDAIGISNVVTSDSVREHHGKDEGPFQASLADAVVFPTSTKEVSKIAQICNALNLPIIPFGTGTGLEGGVNAIKGGISVDLSKMDQITHFNVEDFYVTVQPGITRKGLNAYLKSSGVWFPIDPGADASVCGMAATSASGTNAVRYGTMKENVLNLEVVLADGTVIHTSGKDRCTRKTAAGYNLTNLFVGSEGTLGIITAATVKIYPIPETMVAVVCSFPTVEAAVKTVVQILQLSIPVARIELLDDVAIKACNQYSKTSYSENPTLFMEFHGSSTEVESQALTVGEITASNDGSDFQWAKEAEKRNKLWKARHDMFYACLNLKPGSKCVITDVCVPISKLPEMVTSAKEDIKNSGLIGPILGHVGDGNFHALLLFDPNNKDSYKTAKTLANKLSVRALKLGGTCTGEHGIGQGKISLLEEEMGPNTIMTMKTIKKALDPKGLMNPGKVLLQ